LSLSKTVLKLFTLQLLALLAYSSAKE